VKEDSEQITDFTPTSVGTSNVIQQPEAHLPPKKAMKNTTIIPLNKKTGWFTEFPSSWIPNDAMIPK